MSELPDYKDDALAYEREERARPDEMKMINKVTLTARQYLDQQKQACVLDLCCGTGLPSIGLATHRAVKRLLGVDNSEQYLEFARHRFAAIPHAEFLKSDAILAPLPMHAWNLIIMASAYHHIEDARKEQFLRRVRDLLTVDGVAVVGENILPPYDHVSRNDYRECVTMFYNEVLLTAEANGKLPDDVRGLIQRVAQYGCDGDYEYKVDIETFIFHVNAAGLQIKSVHKVWPYRGILSMTTGGNYVFVLARA